MSDMGPVPHPNAELVRESEVPGILAQVRPSWQSKGLIERVRRLLPVDPSSACQRIFNAAIHDLREKVVTAGLDIAGRSAQEHRLPTVEKPEDIDGYPTAKLIDLCYYIGLLSRPEWRRISRAYEIRRDLEHEDNEYEAGVEDCIYVFGACVQAVLAKDPIQLPRVVDVKQIVQEPHPVTPDAQLVEDYTASPSVRQEEIMRFLVSVSLDPDQPDVVRQNSYNVLQVLSPKTRDQVRISIASELQDQIGRNPITQVQARVANAAGAMPYLRKAQRVSFFDGCYARMEQSGHHWQAHASHGELLTLLGEVGGLAMIPDPVCDKIVKWLVLAYIGEPGGYGTWGRNRRVFYSNTAAPLVADLIREAEEHARERIAALREDRDVKKALADEYVARRFEALVDMTED